MVVIDLATGGPLDRAARPPSSEVRLHLVAYAERPDAACVLHAHPRAAVAFTLAGVEIAQCVLPEVLIGLGSIETTAYATPTTQGAAEAIRHLVRTCDAIILDRHGAVTIGTSLDAAYYNLERLEWAAHVTHAAHQLGGVRRLPKEEVERLLEVRARLTGKPRVMPCNLCGACVGA
jgi:L-fuculose-phosphate aldolase